MAYNNLIFEKDGNIGLVKINRPEVLNAVNIETIIELEKALNEFYGDKDIFVIIITGEGKSFVSGSDISRLAKMNSLEAREYSRIGQRVLSFIEQMEKPVIAAVNGYALGSGCELAMACDVRIVSEKAKFGQAGPRVGSVPVLGATQIMPVLVGEKRAKEVVFLCRTYDAHEAEKMGWINKVVPHDQLIPEVQTWCDEILQMSPTAIALAKKSLNQYYNLASQNMEDGLEAVALYWGTEESREGIRAFKEKRKPDFKKYL